MTRVKFSGARQAAIFRPAEALTLRAAGLGHGFRILALGTDGQCYWDRRRDGPTHFWLAVVGSIGPARLWPGPPTRRRSGRETRCHSRRVICHDFVMPTIVRRDRGAHRPVSSGDQVTAVRQNTKNLRKGGQFIAIDFDIGSARTEPRVQIAEEAIRWIMQAFMLPAHRRESALDSE